jgi:hypothetical protein
MTPRNSRVPHSKCRRSAGTTRTVAAVVNATTALRLLPPLKRVFPIVYIGSFYRERSTLLSVQRVETQHLRKFKRLLPVLQKCRHLTKAPSQDAPTLLALVPFLLLLRTSPLCLQEANLPQMPAAKTRRHRPLLFRTLRPQNPRFQEAMTMDPARCGLRTK